MVSMKKWPAYEGISVGWLYERAYETNGLHKVKGMDGWANSLS